MRDGGAEWGCGVGMRDGDKGVGNRNHMVGREIGGGVSGGEGKRITAAGANEDGLCLTTASRLFFVR